MYELLCKLYILQNEPYIYTVTPYNFQEYMFIVALISHFAGQVGASEEQPDNYISWYQPSQ